MFRMEDRSVGTHVSAIIRDLAADIGILDRGSLDTEPSQQTLLRMHIGSAFEAALISALNMDHPHRYIQPGEQYHDGLFGTPDLFDLDDYAAEEIKLTWKSPISISSDIGPRMITTSESFWMYRCQLMAYCHMLSTTLGRLRICFAQGLGNFSSLLELTQMWELQFSEDELKANWALLKTHEQRIVDRKGDTQ